MILLLYRDSGLVFYILSLYNETIKFIHYRKGELMPFIDSKVTIKLSETQRDTLKTELGKLISTIPGKSETFLMVGFADEYPLYFGGNALDKGAFIEVKIFGTASDSSLETLTQQICELYERELGIPPKSIYVKYEFATHWGWNGQNF